MFVIFFTLVDNKTYSIIFAISYNIIR